jgi:hypothetical protein
MLVGGLFHSMGVCSDISRTTVSVFHVIIENEYCSEACDKKLAGLRSIYTRMCLALSLLFSSLFIQWLRYDLLSIYKATLIGF